MLVQYQTRQIGFGSCSLTPALKILLIVNYAVFALQTLIGSRLDQQLTFYFGLVPPLVLQNLYLWQLFTYQFLHGGLFHLLFNMTAVSRVRCLLETGWGDPFFFVCFLPKRDRG